MANPTTNFGWVMPTNTDLVTDLPADFNVFGQAVDTSMADLKGGTTGQILSKASATDMDFTWIANDQGDITGVTATSPLTGGGTSGAITVGIQDATTSVKGSVQLSDSTSTTSSVLAATPTAVKSAYDLAAAAVPSTTNFFAGKNKIINGDFGIWQRGTSFTTSVYTADRWIQTLSNTTTTTQQTFTPGTAPVSGYEGTYYLQIVNTTSTGANYLVQRIEDVRQLAGQTVTLSFWAKADSACTIQTYYDQNFGSGGSTQASSATTNTAITTAWARYSITTTLGSMSGKTIGTSSYLAPTIVIPAAAGNRTIGIWGVQLEAASTASNFQTATGTKQGELAACQRYLPAFSGGYDHILGFAYSTTGTQIYIKYPTTARVAPTGITVNGTLSGNYVLINQAFSSGTPTAISWNTGGTNYASINVTTTAGSPTLVLGQTATFQIFPNGYILFTGCEL